MDQLQLAKAMNEWMRRFTEEPERFEREFLTVDRFMHEKSAGTEPSYGAVAAEYLHGIAEFQTAA